jgi:hypothetical protein
MEESSDLWSPTGIARSTLLHARVGRHPGQTLAHSSTGKARGLLLPGLRRTNKHSPLFKGGIFIESRDSIF